MSDSGLVLRREGGVAPLVDGATPPSERAFRIAAIQMEAARAHAQVTTTFAVYDAREALKQIAPQRARGLNLIARLAGVR